MSENIRRPSILREFTPIVFNVSSYLVGINKVPVKFKDNMEIEAIMNYGSLEVTGVNYWLDEIPEKGEITRIHKERVIFNINGEGENLYKPRYYQKSIMNYILDLLRPRLIDTKNEVVYEKYRIGKRLYVYGENDTTVNYYWYGVGDGTLLDNL